MSMKEEQEEEADVLLSIYEGDPLFKQVSPTVYHYRYGEENSPRSFVAEITWTDEYPNAVPEINLDLFGNKHLLQEIRNEIRDKLLEQAEANTGMPMTYTLFEWLKENSEALTAAQPERPSPTEEVVERQEPAEASVAGSSKEPKKEKLSKSQKRKLAGRVVHGELPRGHDWVDVVKHLLQSGSAG